MRLRNVSRAFNWPALLLLAAFAMPVACGGLDKVENPDLVGPSEQGVSVEFVAAPDTVNADGVSQSVVRLVLRDARGRPIANRSVLFLHDGDGELLPAPSSIYVGPVQTGDVMATDRDGVAFMHYVAGTDTDRKVRVAVRPYGTDTSLTLDFFRSVEILQK